MIWRQRGKTEFMQVYDLKFNDVSMMKNKQRNENIGKETKVEKKERKKIEGRSLYNTKLNKYKYQKKRQERKKDIKKEKYDQAKIRNANGKQK